MSPNRWSSSASTGARVLPDRYRLEVSRASCGVVRRRDTSRGLELRLLDRGPCLLSFGPAECTSDVDKVRPRLSSYWLHLVTPVRAGVARPLVEGLRNPPVVRDDRIRQLLPRALTSFDAAARAAPDQV